MGENVFFFFNGLRYSRVLKIPIRLAKWYRNSESLNGSSCILNIWENRPYDGFLPAALHDNIISVTIYYNMERGECETYTYIIYSIVACRERIKFFLGPFPPSDNLKIPNMCRTRRTGYIRKLPCTTRTSPDPGRATLALGTTANQYRIAARPLTWRRTKQRVHVTPPGRRLNGILILSRVYTGRML